MDRMTYVKQQWDRVTAWVAVGLGLLLLLVGWIGVSGTGFVFEQLPYVVSGGIGGLFLLGVGAMLWLSADLRDEWRKLDSLERALRETADVVRAPDPARLEDSLDDDPAPMAAEPSATAQRGSRPRRARGLVTTPASATQNLDL